MQQAVAVEEDADRLRMRELPGIDRDRDQECPVLAESSARSAVSSDA